MDFYKDLHDFYNHVGHIYLHERIFDNGGTNPAIPFLKVLKVHLLE